MFEVSELLKSYVQGIRNLSGASTATLYLPASLSGLSKPALVHEGEGEPVPELLDLESAAAFAAAQDGFMSASGKRPRPTTVASADPDSGLIPLPSVDVFWSGGLWSTEMFGTEAANQARRRSDQDRLTLPAAWLGLRVSAGERSVLDRLQGGGLPEALCREEDPARWWEWLFSLGGALASHTSHVSAILKDPITGLPDRTGFQAVLTEEIEKARRHQQSISILLINPDDFAPINERFGREAGDQIIREVSERLRAVLRGSDPLARYGGVIFAAVLSDTDGTWARSVGEKIIQNVTEGAYLNGAVRLGFSIGLTVLDPDDDLLQPLELIRRADQALNAAKRLGGSCIVDWEERSGVEETGAFDRLSGIFTGNMAKDYRNMVLLWEAIDVIAVNQHFDGLAREVVDRLYSTFKPDRIGLYSLGDRGELELVRGLTRQPDGALNQERVETIELPNKLTELLRLAIAAGAPREYAAEGNGEPELAAYAVPLTAASQAVGVLYLDGTSDRLSLDSSDLIFLKALSAQVGVALDRARLTEFEVKRREVERRRLQTELNDLRQALQQAKLVYRSAEMEALVATARRVAPTDATVLITGASGTGKELLARTVHELSLRRSKPFVIVDCGAIATTLIESELFGHEKGAYTGAQARRIGRLAEADGGTVLLDEVAELPLEVQSKLLRFVQEKQFTTVGGTRPRQVDVRIIAATNRDLSADVADGRFREDLYYRLNVVRIEVPALRDRADDILHLARHFLEAFSIQYQKKVRGFTAAAERELAAHSWPGNIRELQNRIMQAVILCEAEELTPAELQLPAGGGSVRDPRAPLAPPVAAAATEHRPTGTTGRVHLDSWEQLRSALARELDVALTDRSTMIFPIGTWIREDLILEANEAGGGVARRGAAIIGIPETTFRRRLSKAQQQESAGLSPRSGRWTEVRSILGEIARSEPHHGDLVKKALRILLEEILERIPDDVATGSRLLGVTPPTFRARLAELERRHSTARD